MRQGCTFKSLSGDVAFVKEYRKAREVVIQFEDGTETTVISCNLRNGEFRNRNKPSIYGVGVIGYGKSGYLKGNVHTKEYKVWYSMIDRCYSPRQSTENPSYIGCSVCEDWRNFQTFCKWYEQQPNAYKDNFDIDKDLRIIGNRIYSPAGCSLVPDDVNSCRAFQHNPSIQISEYGKFIVQYGTGKLHKKWVGTYETLEEAQQVYKKTKEVNIQALAEKYKGVLHTDVYNNMINYRVEYL